MSSSEDCTCQHCQQTFQLEGNRYHNNIYSNRRQDLRHHHGKRRFPPTKKDLFPKDISLKNKFQKKGQFNNVPHLVLFSDFKNQEKNNAATPSKNKVFDHNNPLSKIASNTTFGLENLLHAVGQSQREKLMKCSPSPNSLQQSENIIKNPPLTDRDRRVTDSLKFQKMVNMTKKRTISQLDQNFLKNFVNPQKKIEQEFVASPSEGNSEK